MRPLAPQAELGHTTNSGRIGGRVVLSIRPTYRCVRFCQAASTLSCGVTVAAVADFLLIHGNGVHSPDGLRERIDATRIVPGYHGQPVIVNEDDHFNFDQPDNNFLAALSKRASWGLFDYRKPGEGFEEGFQSVPTDWSTSSARKKGFFTLLKEVSG